MISVVLMSIVCTSFGREIDTLEGEEILMLESNVCRKETFVFIGGADIVGTQSSGK